MNLTIDARLINSSGIGVYLQNIINGFVGSKFDLTLICKRSDQELFANTKAKLILFDAGLYSLKEVFGTPFKTLGSEIFWSPHYNVPIINCASVLKVATIHDVYHLAYYHTLTLKQKWYAKTMIGRAVNSADLIFTVSNYSKAEIIKFTSCKASKIHVVYNGVDYQNFNRSVSEDTSNVVLQKFLIKKPYILFVGNVKPHKNLKAALLGFKAFFNVNKDVAERYTFVIAGRREGFITGDDSLTALLSDNILKARVHFTGWVNQNELPTLYQNASAFVFPSIYEGFGFPALEAMAAGCPVLASNAACLPEIYEDAALYFNPFDYRELAMGLGRILTEQVLREQLIIKGYAQAKKYNWHKTVNEKIGLITEYASKRF